MVDVFISYARKDLPLVAVLARAVEAEGYDVWWDAELPPHKSYGEVITAKIAEARATIVVWSADAVQSEWVRAEADMARNQRKLVQTTLDAVPPPLPFNQIQFAEIGGWRGEPDHPGWRKVKVSLADLCGVARDDGTPRIVSPGASAQAPPPSGRSPRWPLFAGIGVGIAGLAVGAAALFGPRGNAPESAALAASTAVASPAPVDTPGPAAMEPEIATADAKGEPAPAPVVAPVAVPVAAPAIAPVATARPDSGMAGEEAPAEANPSDLTFPDSSTRLLTSSEVYPLGPTTLKVARNEILARKGMRFTNAWLRDWFGRYSWYQPRFDRVPLNPIERQNIALIRQAEARYQ